jgi:hypothetical protein
MWDPETSAATQGSSPPSPRTAGRIASTRWSRFFAAAVRRLDQRVHGRGDVATSAPLPAAVILVPDDGAAVRALSGLVVSRMRGSPTSSSTRQSGNPRPGRLGFRHQGREAIARWLASNPNRVEVLVYLASPPVVELVAPGRARSRTTMTELLRLLDTGEVRQLFGMYTDELVLRGGGGALRTGVSSCATRRAMAIRSGEAQRSRAPARRAELSQPRRDYFFICWSTQSAAALRSTPQKPVFFCSQACLIASCL